MMKLKDIAWKWIILLCLIFSSNCQTTGNQTIPSVKTIETIIENTEEISDKNRKIIYANLRDLEKQIEAQARGYDELNSRHEELSEKYDKLQKKYADSQKDAGWKNLILWVFWGAIGGFVLYNSVLFLKKKFMI